MDTHTFPLAILTVTLLAVTLHAWRLGNEKRDVALLGTFGGVSGLGTALTVIF